jgi:hypothetical protein
LYFPYWRAIADTTRFFPEMQVYRSVENALFEKACAGEVPFGGLGTWADLNSDSDHDSPGETPSRLMSVGLNGYGFIGEVDGASKVCEMPPAALGFVLAQTPASARTPLSSRASVFVPRPPQAVNMPAQPPESTDVPVPGIARLTSTAPAPTTVMLRNLPCSYTRQNLLRTLNIHGFSGLYDFVYLPVDFESMLCKGYAFVNAISGEHAQRMIESFDGYRDWSRCSSSKICQANLSAVQGLDANIDRYRNSPVMGDGVPSNFKPVLFVRGEEVPFPAPTKSVPEIQPKARPLRVRRRAPVI